MIAYHDGKLYPVIEESENYVILKDGMQITTLPKVVIKVLSGLQEIEFVERAIDSELSDLYGKVNTTVFKKAMAKYLIELEKVNTCYLCGDAESMSRKLPDGRTLYACYDHVEALVARVESEKELLKDTEEANHE